MKILQKNIRKILIINFFFLNTVFRGNDIFELEEEVIGKNRKKHSYSYENETKDLKKSFKINKEKLYIRDEDRNDDIILSNLSDTLDSKDDNLLNMMTLRDNMFLFSFEFVTFFNDKTRKLNPFRLLINYNKEINILNNEMLLGINLKMFPKESFRENNSSNYNEISSFLNHKLYKIEGGYSLLEKKIPSKDNKLEEILKKNLTRGKFSLDLDDIIGVAFALDTYYLDINSSTKLRIPYKIFFTNLYLNYSNIFKIRKLNNSLNLHLYFYTDRLMYEDLKEVKNFLKFKIEDEIKDIIKSGIHIKLNSQLETGLFNSKNDFGIMLSGKISFPSNKYLQTSILAKYNSLSKSFGKMIKEIKDLDILVPKNVKREKDFLVEFSGKLEPKKYINMSLGGCLHFTSNKRTFEEQSIISCYPLKIINIDSNWQKLFIDSSFNYSIVSIAMRYEFKNVNFFFVSAHNLKTKIELMFLDTLTVSVKSYAKSSFNTNKNKVISGHFLTNFRINYNMLDFLSLSLKINNILNNKAYYKSDSPIEEAKLILDFKINF